MHETTSNQNSCPFMQEKNSFLDFCSFLHLVIARRTGPRRVQLFPLGVITRVIVELLLLFVHLVHCIVAMFALFVRLEKCASLAALGIVVSSGFVALCGSCVPLALSLNCWFAVN